MECVVCRTANPADTRGCLGCGAALDVQCPTCLRGSAASAKYCSGCGARLHDAGPDAAPDERSDGRELAAEGERRQLTVMFCDIVGSTVLSEHLDAEDLRIVVNAYQQAAATAVTRFDGRIAQYLGDGIVVYFGYPAAHEDDAVRALRAALDLQEAMPLLNARYGERLTNGRELQIRVGIHTGPVVVGDVGASERRERLATGETLNVAARLQALADPGKVVASAATRDLARGAFVFESMGDRHLKGIAEPVAVYRVLRSSGVRARLDLADVELTPLVGREAELTALRGYWHEARQGRGQVVLLCGEPGMGKSRMVHELRCALNEEEHGWLEARSSAHHRNSALHPVIELVQRALLVPQDKPAEQRMEAIERALRRSDLPAEFAPLLGQLVSVPLPEHELPPLSPEAGRRLILESLYRWLFALSRRQPAILVVEDLHWIDPSSLELLGLLCERAASERVLLLLTYRPEFEIPWAEAPYVHHLTLRSLDAAENRKMVDLASDGSLPDELCDEVATRTDGVPLFVEELTRSVQETRRGRGATDGSKPFTIPSTLHDSLMARLDRLGHAKGVAQLAAVIGREFSLDLLEAVSGLQAAEFAEALSKLHSAGLIHRRGERSARLRVFRHALIQETAYQSLLRSTRRDFHGRLARLLRDRHPERAESEPEILAHHLEEAGMLPDAVTARGKAGERAIRRSATVEAISHFEHALSILERLPESTERDASELRLRVAIGAAFLAARGFGHPSAQRAYARARELCSGVEDTSQNWQAVRGLISYYTTRSELEVARELCEDSLTRARRAEQPAARLMAHTHLGNVLYLQGRPLEACEHLERAITLHDPKRDRMLAHSYGTDLGVSARIWAGWAHWALGHPDQAVERCREAIELAREGSHPFSLAYALTYTAAVHLMRREWEQTRGVADEALALALEQGFPLFVGMARLLGARAALGLGPPPSAVPALIQTFKAGLEELAATGARAAAPHALGELSVVLRQAGLEEEALATIDEALRRSVETGQPFWNAELHRMKGELLLARGKTEAENHLLRSLEFAREQAAASLELRAAVSYGRMLGELGKVPEARAVLEPVLARFTEGRNTLDVREASTLLEKLSARHGTG